MPAKIALLSCSHGKSWDPGTRDPFFYPYWFQQIFDDLLLVGPICPSLAIYVILEAWPGSCTTLLCTSKAREEGGGQKGESN